MTSSRAASTSLRRPAAIGFVIGFAMTFVVTLLALMTPAAEAVHPFLVPAAAVLRPVSDRMADWNGLLAMMTAGSVNGIVYAAVFVAVAALVGRRRAGAVG